MQRLEKAKVDAVFILNFNREIAGLNAQDFIQQVLKEKLGLRTVVIGSDFHFGYNRSGSAQTLTEAGISCTSVGLLKDAASAVYSASRIRGLLQAGHIAEANALLGWNWEIQGVVQNGDKRGRELGYPTANIPLGDTIHPSYGIYATRVKIEGEDIWRDSATNIGIRPMFETPVALIETFIFDYEGDLYGKKLWVQPVSKIRDEAKFDSLDALKNQMAQDCAAARKILAA